MNKRIDELAPATVDNRKSLDGLEESTDTTVEGRETGKSGKTMIAVFGIYWAIHIIGQFPTILTKALEASMMKPTAAVTSPAPERSDYVTIPQIPPALPDHLVPPVYAPVSSSYAGQFPNVPPSVVVPSHVCTDPGCDGHDHNAPPKLKPNEKITAVFALGVITDNGRRRIGQPVSIDGVEEIIKATNVRNGVVVFESGKTVTVPK